MTSRAKMRAVLALLIVAGFFGATEVALRVKYRKKKPAGGHGWFEFDDRLGWRHKKSFSIHATPANDLPDLQCSFDVRLNAQGLRETVDMAPVPSAGVHRIACIGDSYTFGYCVAGEAAFPKRLEAGLGPGYEAWNWGVAGYGLDQSLLQLERDVLPTRPELVVFSVIEANFRRATRLASDNGDPKPRYFLEGDRLLLTNVPVPLLRPGDVYYRTDASGSFVAWKLGEGLHNLRKALAKDPDAADEKWTLGRALILEAARLAKAANVRFAVGLMPTETSLGNDWLSRLLPTLEADGIPVLDVTPAFLEAQAKSNERLFVPNDRHPSELGHQIIADRLRAFLEKRQLLAKN